jgi:hypothetical protein
VLYLKDGTRVPGPSTFGSRSTAVAPLLFAVHDANHAVPAAAPFRMGDEPFGMRLYRAYGVPWAKEDVHERLKTMTHRAILPRTAPREIVGAPCHAGTAACSIRPKFLI